jgi:hypothetical protein
MRSLAFDTIPFLLLAGLLLPDPRSGRLATAGVLLAGLATAGAALVLGDGTAGELAGRIAERGVTAGFLGWNAAILLAGLGLAATALAGSWRERPPTGSVAQAVALTASAVVAWPLLRASRPLVALLAAMAAVMLSLAWSVWSAGRGPVASHDRQREWLVGSSVRTRWLAAALAAGAMVVPDFGVSLLLVAVLALLLFARAPRRTPLDRLPMLPLLAAAVVAAAWLAWRAAGHDGLGVAGLGDAAFSPALQVLLGVLVLPSLFVLAGVPPFDRFVPGALLAPVAAALLARSVLPGLADGVEHWRSAGALWLVLGAADAVRRRRGALVLACAALFALVVGGDDARLAGGLLALLASVVDLAPLARRALPGWGGRVVLAAALAAWLVALRATLAMEVVYSVAMAMVLTVGVLRGAGRPAEG